MTAVFDSNILIDLLGGVQVALEAAERYAVREISDVTWMEVMAGARPEEEMRVRRFLANFRRLPITEEVAERAVLERRRRRVKLPDAIVLATAVVRGSVLITRNTRDFPEDEEHVRIPYRLPVQ